MVAWISLFIFDFTIFILTAYKASGMWRAGRGRLIRILFRDGTSLLLNLLQFTLKMLPIGTIYFL